jgi:hypothetical protein
MSALTSFALFKQNYGNRDINLYSTYGFLLLILILEECVEGFLFLRYKKVRDVSYRVSFIKWSYLVGILLFIPPVFLSIVPKELIFVNPIYIICLFSAASFCIIVSYLTIGWLLCTEGEAHLSNSCCFRTLECKILSLFILFISGFGSVSLIDVKIYEYLIGPVNFYIPWLAISLTLGITHVIILVYCSFLKASVTLCDLVFIEKENMEMNDGLELFVGWDRCLYFVLEVLVSLELDGFLPEETNWFILLIPAYLLFISRVALDIYYGNDIYKISIIEKK